MTFNDRNDVFTFLCDLFLIDWIQFNIIKIDNMPLHNMNEKINNIRITNQITTKTCPCTKKPAMFQ